MKKRNKIILTIVAVLAVALVAYLIFKPAAPVEYVTAQVEQGTLTQTVSATGSVKSTENISLNFATTGRITGITAKVGDQVKRGQLLARLDAGDLAVQLRQTKANLASTEASLQKILVGSSQEETAVSQEQVNSAEAAYNAAAVDLTNAEKERAANLPLYQDTALSDLNNYLFKGRSALDVIKRTYEDSAGQNYISNKNQQDLINTKEHRDRALLLLIVSESTISQAKTGSVDQVITALDNLLIAEKETALALEAMFNALLNTSTSYSFTDSNLDTLKTNIKTEQTANTAGIDTLQTDRSNLQTKQLDYDSAVDTAQGVLNLKKQAWDLAQAQYNLTVAAPKTSDVAYYQALVDQARAQVAAVEQKMSDRVIVSPSDGVVTKVESAVGETSSLTGAVLEMLPNNPYYIEVDISEADIAKVKVGDQVKYTLDAYGSELNFVANVLAIEPAETVISGVIYYKVKIDLAKNDHEIKPGMTANIDILTAEKPNVLYIPLRAVKRDGEKKLVDVVRDPKTKAIETVEVETGLRGDDGLVEITSGLQAGQEIVVSTKNGKK